MKSGNTALLALLSAFLMWLAWPPIPYTTPLLLVGLVPLLIALDKLMLKAEGKTGKKIFLTAGLTFLVWNTASIYWVYNAISAVNNAVVAAFVSLIPFGLGALLMTFAFWLYYRLSRVASKNIAYLGLLSFYVAMEYLHQSWDLAFPWMTLGNGLSGMHQLAQWYEYTGVYGGSVWILLSNILAFEAYKKFKTVSKGYTRLRPVLGWALFILLPAGLSLTKYSQYKEKEVPVNVVAVQPNIDPYLKFGGLSSAEQLAILTRLSDSVAQPNTEYFIWPETAIPSRVDEDRIRSDADFMTAQRFLEKYKNGTLITGIESIKFYPDQQTLSARKYNNDYVDVFNGAIQIENSANVQFYHKSKLVPGVEKMPFPTALAVLAPVFEGFGGTVGGYGSQKEPGVFYAYSGIGVAPVICYESIWGDWIGQAVKNGAQFIAILTNDGWWGNTSGKDQHLMYARLRAIENRRYVVRSANTGISCFINQKGDIIKQAGWWTRTALKADINLNDELTLYTKTGDVIAKVLCVVALLLALIIPYKKWIKKAG
ncbi:apolipoprotein N-acyltransferase [Pedobacter heparinus]|uniref:Apolipoprotein N-acyltransferase n=1 Tax=Pedobacter heparinus (strain ATCC 13125 / DSM 2366 / CIP 104194 / JCM 7457 / NBRC 12017 / NCIMB 9290 / NRRL B-14731 / HIM 762-3) TaxID=485917 RepID=C6XZU1_PEDHD|nr:apolipoprotein N-acyltransferase [Pedobacter heparinus]ACU02636.1 apolipoprotein N-acyltransferase [Pedobacter heparinus DSM 2366]